MVSLVIFIRCKLLTVPRQEKPPFTYGYAGSLLQLDFGEDPCGHGFLLWDLSHKTGSTH